MSYSYLFKYIIIGDTGEFWRGAGSSFSMRAYCLMLMSRLTKIL